jgi:transposase
MFGGLSLTSQKFYWKQADKGESKNFLLFLLQLHQNFPAKHLHLILDNGAIHKSKAVKQFLQRHAWVTLHFLTPYSPEYNPVERFWKWLKRNVYGAQSFRTMDAILGRIRKLIWHYHEKRLVSSIRFNFNDYACLL